MTLKRFILPGLLALLVVAFVGRGMLHRSGYDVTPGAAADPGAAFTNGEPNLVAATFYSAWCSACAVLDPKLRDVAPAFEGRAVTFHKFDFSLGQPDRLQADAEALGIGDIYRENKGATGFMTLVDRRNQEVLATITMGQSRDEIRQTIEAGIDEAAQPLEAQVL